MKNYLFLVLIFFISGCVCDEAGCGDISYPPEYSFVLRDGIGVDQVAYGKKYDKDSVRLEVNGTNIISETRTTTINNRFSTTFSLNTTDIDLSLYNDSLYTLYFRYGDIDTVKIKATWVTLREDNITFLQFDEFLHNEKSLPIQPSSTKFLIVK